ncbi:MAG: extracellular solute-binding protein [Elusimicrobiota bacterium]
MLIRSGLSTSVALAAALAVPTQAAVPATAPADVLYEAAKKDGGLDWYAIPLPYNDAVIREFSNRYPGVPVRPFYSGGTQLVQRFKMEKSQGREIADCVSSGLTEAFPEFRRKGWLAPLDSLPHWNQRPAWAKDPHGAYFYYANFRIVLMWNTTLVKNGEEPLTIKELAEPRWRGRVVMFDPTSAGVAVPLYRWIVERLGFGLRWLKALRANDVQLAANAAQMDEAVASGRRAVALTRDTEARGAMVRGAPISFRVPEEGTMLHFMPIAINKGAPHPNAARLFVDWLLSDEGRKALDGQNVGIAPSGEGAFHQSRAWAFDAESVNPEETKNFIDRVVLALKG